MNGPRNYTLLDHCKIGRQMITPGDTVWCRPMSGRRFRAVVVELRQYANSVTCEVLGGPAGYKSYRSFAIERVAPDTSAR
jgi:hypothetical protein